MVVLDPSGECHFCRESPKWCECKDPGTRTRCPDCRTELADVIRCDCDKPSHEEVGRYMDENPSDDICNAQVTPNPQNWGMCWEGCFDEWWDSWGLMGHPWRDFAKWYDESDRETSWCCGFCDTGVCTTPYEAPPPPTALELLDGEFREALLAAHAARKPTAEDMRRVAKALLVPHIMANKSLWNIRYSAGKWRAGPTRKKKKPDPATAQVIKASVTDQVTMVRKLNAGCGCDKDANRRCVRPDPDELLEACLKDPSFADQSNPVPEYSEAKELVWAVGQEWLDAKPDACGWRNRAYYEWSGDGWTTGFALDLEDMKLK